MKLRITISKYHSRYLCQISLQIMLLPIQMYIWICDKYSSKLGSSSVNGREKYFKIINFM